MKNTGRRRLAKNFLAGAIFTLGCGGSTPTTVNGLKIVSATTNSDSLAAVAGAALSLTVVETLSDGSQQALPVNETITWSGAPTITALDPSSTAASPIPATSSTPTAFFLHNALRTDRKHDSGVLFVLDQGSAATGTLVITATVNTTPPQITTSTITISAALVGDATRGHTAYSGAGCGDCHGSTGAGTTMPTTTGGDQYSINGMVYPFPAPGLNAAAGNVASDPDWSPAMFAIAARADIDNNGLELRLPMVDWLDTPNPATHALLATQDFADIYAYMKTLQQ